MAFIRQLQGKHLYCVGIKGSGMTTLALMLQEAGVEVSGYDSAEHFWTETALLRSGIQWSSEENAKLPETVDLVIHSTAWQVTETPLLQEAVARQLPLYSYPQFLSLLSKESACYGVAGTHGKTTVTAAAHWMLAASKLSYYALYGSVLQNSEIALFQGDQIGLLEACEYQDHLLLYTLQGMLITNLELDHPDWFSSEEQLFQLFLKRLEALPKGAFVILSLDSPLSQKLRQATISTRSDLIYVTYGLSEAADFQLIFHQLVNNEGLYQLRGFEDFFRSPLAGATLTSNLLGAALLSTAIVLQQKGRLSVEAIRDSEYLTLFLTRGATFKGTVGRSEEFSLANGALLVNDYAHHPTEIRTTLAAYRQRYPQRRFIVIFTPHTLSRTQIFFDDFCQALKSSDKLYLRAIDYSRRQDGSQDEAQQLLADLAACSQAIVCENDVELARKLQRELLSNDLCITMGAGNKEALLTLLRA